MRTLKYIKLFEAFESVKLTKTLGYVNTKGREELVNKLKSICKNINFPMSQLDDSYFQYLPFQKALNLTYTPKPIVCRATSKSMFSSHGIEGEVCQSGKMKRLWGARQRVVDCPNCNGTGIQPENEEIKLIKFWFSKDGQFITFSGVDNISTPTLKKMRKKLNKNLSNYITVGDRVPETTRATNQLETGDIILAKIRAYDPEIVCYVYKHSRYTYFLQDNFDGDTPSTRGWREIARLSWNVTNGDYIWYQKLEPKNKKSDDESEIDPFSFNKSINFDYRGSVKLDRYQSSDTLEKLINKADFALIFDLDKLKTSEFKTTQTIKSEREEIKKGSVLTQKNEDIKKANIARYMQEISKRSDIVSDISNLSKVIKRMSGNENVLFFILTSQRFTGFYGRLATLYTDAIAEDKMENYYKSNLSNYITERYKASASNSANISNNLNSITDFCKDNDLKIELKIIEGFKSLSHKLYQKISDMNFECVEDIDILKAKLDAIRSVFRLERYRLDLADYFIDSLTNDDSSMAKRYLTSHYYIQDNKEKIISGIEQANKILDRF